MKDKIREAELAEDIEVKLRLGSASYCIHQIFIAYECLVY